MTDPDHGGQDLRGASHPGSARGDHQGRKAGRASCRHSADRPGLNLATILAERGVLEKYHVELIGADYAAIKKAEDREEFKAAMEKIGLEVPRLRLRPQRGTGAQGGEGDRLPRHH